MRHGLMRGFLVRRARAGAIGARIMIDPALRDDPYPSYEQLRGRGRMVVTGLAPTTADHAVCTAVLRSPDFGTGEVLRFDSPVQRTARLAHRDTEVAGERFTAGQLVVLILAGANRDPAVFADPQCFDVTRTGADRHVAFSQGIHYCLGAGLARLEGEIGLRALAATTPCP
jgi:cytochrome P450